MRQEELKHPSSSMHGSNLADLVGRLGWKGTGILILSIIVGESFMLPSFNKAVWHLMRDRTILYKLWETK